jgi:hypothetical protein
MNTKLSVGFVLAVGLVVCGLSRGQVRGKEEQPKKSDRARALKFLREHVVGKTVATQDTIIKYAGNKVEGVSSGTDSYTNLVETDDGFKFDVVTVSKLTNYDLDNEGKRVKPGRNEDATYLTRYHLTERKSTGKLVGTARVISSTHKTFTAGQTVAVLMTVQKAGLQTKEHSLFYEDFFEAKGKWKAGASESTIRFFLEKDKLRVEGENLQFDVDPETLKKTRTADPPMKWKSKQTD